MIGEKLLHYLIISKLGSGGMGEVYLALDTALNRQVAIKVLSRDLTSDLRAIRYFRREAQAAAKLDHPNICTIHEISEDGGRSFIVMQYVKGETLAARIQRQPLEPGELLSVACQLADALAAAHSVGIIHRDIKPHNIMLTPKGQVKVLDFGLATRPAAVGLQVTAPGQAVEGGFAGAAARDGLLIADNGKETLSLRSEPGELVGTVPYMSPEQVSGQSLDVRTDVFSFGSVICEAGTGRPPFARADRLSTMRAICSEPSPPLTLRGGDTHGELQRIVQKCLEKRRDDRYNSAKELFTELDELRRKTEMLVVTDENVGRRPRVHRLVAALMVALLLFTVAVLVTYVGGGVQESPPGTSSGLALRSIAVLPLKNAGGDPATDYLGDGLTVSLINQLSQIPNLKVISRGSVFRYKGQDPDLRSVGSDLNVEAVLTGNIEQRGANISIFLTLWDVGQNRPLWGRRFVSNQQGVLELQSDVLRSVTEELRPQSAAPLETQFKRRSTQSIEAYNLYLKGTFHLNKRTPASLAVALDSFREAVEIDPNYALAYAGLADTYCLLDDFSMGDAVVSQARAEEAARRALAIDPELAEAHSTLGLIYRDDKKDWPAAERELRRAIELSPNYALTYNRYGWYLISLGRLDEALMYMRQAQDLDPRSLNINTSIGLPYYFARNYEKAIEEFHRTLQLDPDFYPSNFYLALAYVGAGRADEGIEILERLRKVNDGPDIATVLAYAYAQAGQRDQTRKLLRYLKELRSRRTVSAHNIAICHAQLDEYDEAFHWLERAREEHTMSSLIKVHPMLDPLRGDPRFQTLLRELNLAD